MARSRFVSRSTHTAENNSFSICFQASISVHIEHPRVYEPTQRSDKAEGCSYENLTTRRGYLSNSRMPTKAWPEIINICILSRKNVGFNACKFFRFRERTRFSLLARLHKSVLWRLQRAATVDPDCVKTQYEFLYSKFDRTG